MNDLAEKLESEFQGRIKQLEDANRDWQKFAVRAAHDLQEALRMMATYMGLVEEVCRDNSDPALHQYLSSSKEGGKRMQALVNDILTFARVGSEELNLTYASLETALNWARYGLADSLKDTAAVIEESALSSADIDVTKISLVFQHLLANAVKFRKPGENPRIHVEGGVTQSDSGEEWVVSVRDEGIGFEPQYSQKIFGPFERLHAASKYPGTGMGLAVCKRIIEAHGGRIWAEGRPNEGATFYFTVPAESSSRSTAAGSGS
jgi:light-regulated signal transduction histidine kinase (bacteriophytochrome)